MHFGREIIIKPIKKNNMYPILKKNLLLALSGAWLAAASCTTSPQTAPEASSADDVYKTLTFEMASIERTVCPD